MEQEWVRGRHISLHIQYIQAYTYNYIIVVLLIIINEIKEVVLVLILDQRTQSLSLSMLDDSSSGSNFIAAVNASL